MAQYEWPAGTLGASAFFDLPSKLSDDPGVQSAIQRLINSVAFKTDLKSDAPAEETTFLSLPDTPDSYTGAAGEVVVVGEGETGVEFAEQTFLGLTDTPDDYKDQKGKVVSVNTDETGLEFTSAGSGGTYPYVKGGKAAAGSAGDTHGYKALADVDLTASTWDSGGVVSTSGNTLTAPEAGYYTIVLWLYCNWIGQVG